MDEKRFLSNFVGLEDLIAPVINKFLEVSPSLMDQIRQSIAAKDPEALRRCAHSFKGAVANFQTNTCIERARDLERIGEEKTLDSAPAAFRLLEEEVTRLAPILTRIAREYQDRK